MKQKSLFLYTRTPLHVGGGSSVGAIDLPVQRERHTRHPIIPGSSIKGVLRYTADQLDDIGREKVDDIFGPETAGKSESEARAGDLSFSEARPLAFPVRSAKGAFAYITCPLALQRFARDCEIALSDLPEVDDQNCCAGSKVVIPGKNRVVLEEYAFSNKESFPTDWEQALLPLVDDAVWKEARGRLVLLSDGDFSHFVSSTTEITNHIKIDPKTGTVARGALFNIESVPAETLFVSTVSIAGRPEAQLENGKKAYATDGESELAALIENHPVLQFGGNSTTGRGYCSLSLGKPETSIPQSS